MGPGIMARCGCQVARVALLAAAGMQMTSSLTFAPKVITNSPVEEFSKIVAQAVQNLSSQFTEFHSAMTNHTLKLTKALTQENHVNHAVEAMNAQITQDVANLRQKNQGLRQQAKVLVDQNEQLRRELQGWRAQLSTAEKLVATAIEGSSEHENADLKAAETLQPKELPEATRGHARGVGKVATRRSVDDFASVEAGSSASHNLDIAAVMPTMQGFQESADDGYPDAFNGDDDGGSMMEEPSPENAFSPDDVSANDEDAGVALLSIAKARHRHVGHFAKAIVKIPSAVLPSSVDGFAEFEKNTLASLQRSFEAQLQRTQMKHDRLMQKQRSLNDDKESLEALQPRLASVFVQLEHRHSRLQLRVRSIGDFVQHLAAVAREPVEQAEVTLRSTQVVPTL